MHLYIAHLRIQHVSDVVCDCTKACPVFEHSCSYALWRCLPRSAMLLSAANRYVIHALNALSDLLDSCPEVLFISGHQL